MRYFLLFLFAAMSYPSWAANEFNASVEKDVAEVCRKFDAQKAYDDNGKAVYINCEFTKQQNHVDA